MSNELNPNRNHTLSEQSLCCITSSALIIQADGCTELTPKEALSLLAYLFQEQETLEQMTKEQV